MKKLILPCMLAFSLMVSAQRSNLPSGNLPTDLMKKINLELMIENLPETYAGEEEEITFDFDVTKYLPTDFDVYSGMIIDESYLLEVEEIPFEFDIKKYLPVGFDPYKGMIIEEKIEEEEIPFDFDIKKYLPVGFDPHKKVNKSNM